AHMGHGRHDDAQLRHLDCELLYRLTENLDEVLDLIEPAARQNKKQGCLRRDAARHTKAGTASLFGQALDRGMADIDAIDPRLLQKARLKGQKRQNTPDVTAHRASAALPPGPYAR